jgi:TRAP-type C4-dicarboxylate transport system permease small subunit
MHYLDNLCHRLNRSVETLLFGMGITMAAIVAVQVFFRYVLNASLFWSEEVARYLLVWLTFLGATTAYYRGSHPGIDALTRRLPPFLQRIAACAAHGAAAGIAMVMIIYGIRFAWFVRLQISPALSIPKWIIFAVIPIAGLLLLIQISRFIAHTLTGERL